MEELINHIKSKKRLPYDFFSPIAENKDIGNHVWVIQLTPEFTEFQKAAKVKGKRALIDITQVIVCVLEDRRSNGKFPVSKFKRYKLDLKEDAINSLGELIDSGYDIRNPIVLTHVRKWGSRNPQSNYELSAYQTEG